MEISNFQLNQALKGFKNKNYFIDLEDRLHETLTDIHIESAGGYYFIDLDFYVGVTTETTGDNVNEPKITEITSSNFEFEKIKLYIDEDVVKLTTEQNKAVEDYLKAYVLSFD